MRITAKYSGVCRECGQDINPGDEIEWAKGVGSRHVECATSTPEEQGLIVISGGSGYGCSGWTPGQVLRHQGHGGVLKVVQASKRFYKEDGLSFGVGDDSGYVYIAKCCPATEEEAAPLLEQERLRGERRRLRFEAENLRIEIRESGEMPEGVHLPEGERLLDAQDIYGGGDWFVVGPEWIWYVLNNGADGDDWSRNNVHTGGAGAIGWRTPYSRELAQRLIDLNRLQCTLCTPIEVS